jgi:hypothetical protein
MIRIDIVRKHEVILEFLGLASVAKDVSGSADNNLWNSN